MGKMVDNVNLNHGRLVRLAQAAKEQVGRMTVDDLIDSIVRLTEVERAVYSRSRNFDVAGALREYAASLNKTVQNLTEDEKRQAFLDHILKNSEASEHDDGRDECV